MSADGGQISARPHCQEPAACRAKGAGHCRSCHFKAVAEALHADPEFAAKNAAAASARMKALRADPEFAAKHAARMKALHADPEFAAKNAARMKALNADPEFAAKNAARMKALHADPEFAAKHAAAASARMKALRADPEFAAKALAARAVSKAASLGITIDELPEWREIRSKGFSAKEAAHVVISSRKGAA